MNPYLVSKLKEGRIGKGLKQSDVAKVTGIKNTTLSNYENGVTEPDMDTFLQLCELYELDYFELLSEAYGYTIPGYDINLGKSDIELVRKYHALDDGGRRIINVILDIELERLSSLTLPSKPFAQNQIRQDSTPVQIGVDEALSYINGEHPINRFAAQKGLADSPENREFTEHLADALHKDIHKTLEDHRNEKDRKED